MGLGKAHITKSNITEEFGWIADATVVTTVEVSGRDHFEALINALAHPDVPVAGEPLSMWVPHVRVETRTPVVVGIVPDKVNHWYVEVTTNYRQQRPVDNAPGNDAQQSLRGGASLTGVSTEKHRDGVTPIEVTYRGDKQRGEVNVFEVQGHLSREFRYATDDPEAFVAQWINHVNKEPWKGGGIKEWLCTRVDYQLVDSLRVPPIYRFAMDFERRPTKWVYTAAYRDSKGVIPGDVSDKATGGTSPYGIIDVEWHPERDFNDLFQT